MLQSTFNSLLLVSQDSVSLSTWKIKYNGTWKESSKLWRHKYHFVCLFCFVLFCFGGGKRARNFSGGKILKKSSVITLYGKIPNSFLISLKVGGDGGKLGVARQNLGGCKCPLAPPGVATSSSIDQGGKEVRYKEGACAGGVSGVCVGGECGLWRSERREDNGEERMELSEKARREWGKLRGEGCICYGIHLPWPIIIYMIEVLIHMKLTFDNDFFQNIKCWMFEFYIIGAFH